MEESVREVLYEARHHASRPFTSNYPPLPLQQSNEVDKGGFLSLLSARGLSQLKEKWVGSKNQKKIKKPASLIVSPGGERVAVAAGNQVTILRKEEDYLEPFGIFTSGSIISCACGAWSESHDILGLVDDADVIYFIKANGEEITRITTKHLKVSSKVIGLIAPDDSDVKQSFLCSFTVLTSDGAFHHIEISHDPSTSISSTINSDLALKKQFPRNALCFDSYPEPSLLVIVGSAGGSSITTDSKSGSCYLSLWRKDQGLVLEPVASTQFESFYSQPKDYAAHLAHPKVLISPQGNYIAALDMNGCLHIFKLDKESCLVTNFAFKVRTSHVTDKWINECSENLADIVDFTWWSDHILTLAKRNGFVTMLDILSGLKLIENEPVYSQPVLERVRQFEGYFFVLESLSSEDGFDLSNSNRITNDLHQPEETYEDGSNRSDISKLRWSLISFSERSVPEMYKILIDNSEHQAALDFADRHGLDRDEVLKSQWLGSDQGTNDINAFLSNIKDKSFVLSECVNKVGASEEIAKALLAYGLEITNGYKFSESNNQESDEIWDFRMSRLQLLYFRDRLETFLGINMGRFSMQEYSKFRVMPMNEVAITLSENGKIGALNLLFKRHPYSLVPFMLDILAAIPETIPVQTYVQLLPGKSPPASTAMREEDWVECDNMVSFINKLPDNHDISSQIRTEPVVKRLLGSFWPSVDDLAVWYKHRARDIDSYSGLLDNCLYLIDFACQKGIYELNQFHEDISYLHQLVYADNDGEMSTNMSLVAWEQLSDYEKFRTMLHACKEENVVESLRNKAIPFMHKRSHSVTLASQEQIADGHSVVHHTKCESFLVRWLKEISLANKLDVCLMVIEEGCRELQSSGFFKNEVEVVDCALECVYLFTVTDRWSTMSAILLKLPHKQDSEICIGILEQRCKVAEGHIEAGRLLAFYQVPKPMIFFLEAHSDEKGVKQIVRLILSKFIRRQPARSDNEWATMWRDMLCLREKAFPFLDLEYLLTEFCRGLLKAGKFSLARSYLRGTSSAYLATEKAENLVIQAAREYFFSASSLSCSEIWKAKECLNLFPSSKNVKAEADIIDALTVKLPYLGVTLLPVQFRQIKDPLEIIKMAVSNQAGAYLHVDELIEVAKLLGLNSLDEISGVEEIIAREAAVAGDLQLAFDLCLVLAKKGHGLVWDLCAALARGPLENMDISSRKQLLGFALSHCDEESVSELLHAWKDLDMQGQCETLMAFSGTNSPNFSIQGSSVISLPGYSIQDIVDLKNASELVDGFNSTDQGIHISRIKNTLSLVAKNLPVENGTNWDLLLQENGKILSFTAIQLPWLLELTSKEDYSKKFTSGLIPGKQYVSVRTQAVITILSWLARNGFAPRDDLITSLAKSIIEPPVTEEEDVIGCSFLLNLVDAFSGVQVIEEQLRMRENYLETCSIMNVGMIYSILHNTGVDCEGPTQRRELLLGKFRGKNKPLNADDINRIDEVQSSFWREWKLKLEEKKRVAEHSRFLEQIIPGVETARFLSGDSSYIESVIFSLIESLKLEKKHILKDILKLADTYGLNRTEVILRYLTSILISEIWTNDDIMAEISEIKGEILDFAAETIKTISLIVYPAVDGCNKHRLAYIYSLLSDCYKKLEESKEPLPMILSDQSHAFDLGLVHYYKVIEQECKRISFVEGLNFKNITGLGGLNLQCFSSEVYAHTDEFSLEALSEMVKTLVGINKDLVPEGLIPWQDVRKHYILCSLTNLKDRVRREFSTKNPENFLDISSELEQIYDLCRKHIKLLEPSDALDILKQYFIVIIPLDGDYRNIPDNSTWQDCLIFLLNFWLRLTEEMQEFACTEISEEKTSFHPDCLMSRLKVFMKLVMEDSVSPSQGWSTIVDYVNHGLIGGPSLDIFTFCRAMVFAGCGFASISEVFVDALQHHVTTLAALAVTEFQDLSHLYLKVLEPILQDLTSGPQEHQKLYQLMSSLSNLEGDFDELTKVRCAVWERIARFSEDLLLASNVRVHVLELMQFITGKTIKGLSSELQLNVHQWIGWDESLCASNKSRSTLNEGLPEQIDASSRFTSTLVALRSSQLMAAISPGFEITPDDLSTVDTSVSCFLKLCAGANADPHLDVLVAILEEWEGLFAIKKEGEASAVLTNAENNWSNDDWDEGWESFQEIEPLEKEKKGDSLSIHPLHVCWTEIMKGLIKASRVRDVLKLMDQSISKSSGVLLDEGDARSLNDIVLGVDCLMASKMMLLLPYEGLQLESLSALENRLKKEGTSNIGSDHELLMLVLSSGILSTVINKSSLRTVFSYVCYLVGNFSCQFQEAQLPRLGKKGGSNEHGNTKGDIMFIFARILFPMFVLELVKADQQILAGFVVTKFMHTSASFRLINIAEASLRRYLERQLQVQEHADETSCEPLKNTVSSLREKLGNSLHSALSLLPRNESNR
ncbi:MAG2-interacting protein 2 [Hibiscus trionum]|uniref:MAG2-interacting protein 2 n=1 Tax=Hibiscus trionum TaxID=183268 RepID=A0A9W7IV26_HIBTR|nr:MAG2-interacting protein 2 [Hibiscus trionum]